jgi:hypothetical protein
MTAARTLPPELASAEIRLRPMVPGDAPALPESAEDDGPKPLLLPDVASSLNAPTDETGKLAATARARNRPELAEPLAELAVTLVPFAAAATAAEVATGAQGAELDATAAIGAADEHGPGTRTVTRESHDWNRLTPAQRRYVAEYFAARERSAEPGRTDP